MRPGNNTRRPRGRPNRKQHVSPRAQTFDSHGPDVRIRGNAPQVYEKYLSLARDAHSSGDRVASESYYQFAEHYFRIMNDSTDPQRNAPPQAETQDQPQSGAPEAPRAAPVEPAQDDQEQPHVEWPGQVDGVNGSQAKQPSADQAPAKEVDEPSDDNQAPAGDEAESPRRSAKPRGRSRRRPTNGAAEKDEKSETAADEDSASALADQETADKATPTGS